MEKLTDEQINERLENGWTYDGDTLLKEYEFKDDREANDFVNKIAEIANELNHHPEIKCFSIYSLR